MSKDMSQELSEVSRSQCNVSTSIRKDWVENDHNTTNNRLLSRMGTTKAMSSDNGIVVWNRKRRMTEIWTQNEAMHRWISLTTALEAEGNWIVTLTVHDHTQTQPIPISEWRGRGGGEEWVVFVGVGGDERELVMVYLCLYWFCFSLCLWYCSWCVFIWFWLFRWLRNQVDWRMNSDPSTQ